VSAGLPDGVAGSAGAQQREDRDASAVHSNLGVAKLAGELDLTTSGDARAGPILDASFAYAAQLVVVDIAPSGTSSLTIA
jgi:hypothetical protein